MSGRTTAEIVADLRVGQHFLFGERVPFTLDNEAADRLVELDAEVKRLDALRPPCPTCGGTTWEGGTAYSEEACPDCLDGMVSIERMAKVFARVFMFPGDGRDPDTWAFDAGWRACIDHLRAIR